MSITSKTRKEAGGKPPLRPETPRDYQEEYAVKCAAEALAKFGPAPHETLAYVVISAWIVARTSAATKPRLHYEHLFDLDDARLRGFVDAALPRIAATLTETADIPGDAPLFALSKAQIVDVFMAGIVGAREAAVALNESLGFPFSDEIPFG